jgi:hypothetical protein
MYPESTGLLVSFYCDDGAIDANSLDGFLARDTAAYPSDGFPANFGSKSFAPFSGYLHTAKDVTTSTFSTNVAAVVAIDVEFRDAVFRSQVLDARHGNRKVFSFCCP